MTALSSFTVLTQNRNLFFLTPWSWLWRMYFKSLRSSVLLWIRLFLTIQSTESNLLLKQEYVYSPRDKRPPRFYLYPLSNIELAHSEEMVSVLGLHWHFPFPLFTISTTFTFSHITNPFPSIPELGYLGSCADIALPCWVTQQGLLLHSIAMF